MPHLPRLPGTPSTHPKSSSVSMCIFPVLGTHVPLHTSAWLPQWPGAWRLSPLLAQGGMTFVGLYHLCATAFSFSFQLELALSWWNHASWFCPGVEGTLCGLAVSPPEGLAAPWDGRLGLVLPHVGQPQTRLYCLGPGSHARQGGPCRPLAASLLRPGLSFLGHRLGRRECDPSSYGTWLLPEPTQGGGSHPLWQRFFSPLWGPHTGPRSWGKTSLRTPSGHLQHVP